MKIILCNFGAPGTPLSGKLKSKNRNNGRLETTDSKDVKIFATVRSY